MLLVQHRPDLGLDVLQHVGGAVADTLAHMPMASSAAASLSKTLMEPKIPSSKATA
jgi:hypothetical protein